MSLTPSSVKLIVQIVAPWLRVKKHSPMKKLIKSSVIALSLFAASVSHAKPAKKLVTIVTSPEAQTQLMAMVLTFHAVQQGAEADILLCGTAGDMALKDAPEGVRAPQKLKDMNSQGLMSMILEKTSTTAEVCAIYLPNADLQADALMNGVTAVNPEVMAARLLAHDTRIMSF